MDLEVIFYQPFLTESDNLIFMERILQINRKRESFKNCPYKNSHLRTPAEPTDVWV